MNGVQRCCIDALTIRRVLHLADSRDGKVLTGGSLTGRRQRLMGTSLAVIKRLETDDDDTTPIQFYPHSASDAETERFTGAPSIGFCIR